MNKKINHLGSIKFIQENYPSNKKEATIFRKQFKTFKQMNKRYMNLLKKGDIKNLCYVEEEGEAGEIIGKWFIEETEIRIEAAKSEEIKAPELKTIPEIKQEEPEPEEINCHNDCENCPDDNCDNNKRDYTKVIPEADQKEISKAEVNKLFAKIKASKPYKSTDYAGKLIDILLNNKAEAVEELNKNNREYPATYKQTRALYRIIFGKHYDHNTYESLIRVLN